MIETRELTRLFDDTVAVDRLTVRVDRGEILGFLGPNGAGKSTTVKMLTGMIRPTSGSASIAGLDIVTRALDVKRRIGYVPESGAMYESLTAAEHLELIGMLESGSSPNQIERFAREHRLRTIEARDRQLETD